MMRSTLLFVVITLLAVCSVSAIQNAEIEETILAPNIRNQMDMAEMAEKLGLVELASLSDLAEEQLDAQEGAADQHAEEVDSSVLLEAEVLPAPKKQLPATAIHYVFDDEDKNNHVFVEAATEADLQAEAAKKTAKKAAAKSSSKGPDASGPVSTVAELLPVQSAPAKGEKQIPNTFPQHIPSSAAPEAASITKKRMEAAVRHIDKLAYEESKAEYQDYQNKLRRHQYNEAVKKARQSKNFERALPPSSTQLPHPSSHDAVENGDRNYNTLFPAATAKSDGKANSQLHDFHNKGHGDAYVNHLNLIEHQNEAATTTENEGEGEAEAEGEAAAEGEGAAEGEAQQEGAAQEGQEQEGETSAPADKAGPEAPLEPCARQCEGVGLWKTAACQDCIVRGMVNGFIVKSIQEQQRGYNYIHWARNQCVNYANQLHLRTENVKGAPFAHCFFQKVHESCNL